MAVLACNPNTLRPPFLPLPQAVELELELPMGYAMEVTAEALRLDSIPVTVVHARDGYLETDWFESRTGEPSHARPLGVEMVRVRAWATPGRVGHTDLIIETVYRPLADPSRPSRDLERLVSPDHPVALRLDVVVRKLIEQFGDPDQLAIPQPPPPVRPDTVARPDTTVRPDTIARPDTTTRPDTIVRPRPDTLAARPSVLLRILQGG
ncbi:MAG: hypothetical protein ABR602_00370 [Gemmatimonadales bacterium]